MDWETKFLELAAHVANWSKDPSTKVGCVLVDGKRRVIGIGYNGFPRGVCDCEERLNHRETKYMFVQHAETNAIHQCPNPEGATAYVTHHPCCNCAGSLIQAGIVKVVTNDPPEDMKTRYKDSFEISQTMFKEAGVELIIKGRHDIPF